MYLHVQLYDITYCEFCVCTVCVCVCFPYMYITYITYISCYHNIPYMYITYCIEKNYIHLIIS